MARAGDSSGSGVTLHTRRPAGGRATPAALFLAAAALFAPPASAGSCSHLTDCSGHGTCDAANSRCLCYNGYGSASDIALYKSPDCSLRALPASRAPLETLGDPGLTRNSL
jgi:hypothetical protein